MSGAKMFRKRKKKRCQNDFIYQMTIVASLLATWKKIHHNTSICITLPWLIQVLQPTKTHHDGRDGLDK
jgi:hypothetical protein